VKLPVTAHTERPWRIHDIAPDFRVEDVWALPTPGGPDDFPDLVELVTRRDAAASSSPVVRALFALRWKVGALLGWDDHADGTGGRVSTLRDRVPADLRDTGDATPAPAPFTTLYLTADEWAAETANKTVHGVLHLGWVPDGEGGHRGQMAVLVKPSGRFGDAYMAAIKPFRHRIVYPLMLRDLERRWRERG
jgi:Protein of unknown function (DUF2867)